ncbi:MAG: mechanosensitive ion channel [Xenococcaceae cyanobacterium MO_167.B52]|nr:mechanosensitive ion channel [Xenococcaceae cyanobacterium MO_167.B52]
MLYTIFLDITISELIPETITINTRSLIILLIIFIALFLLPRLITWGIASFFTPQNKELYQVVVAPYFSQIALIFLMTLGDLVLLNLTKSVWLKSLELILSIALVILLNWLTYQIFQQIFNNYLLSAAVKNRGQFNSEFLLLSKFLVNITITFVVIFIFAQIHHINLVGLLASLGIGGLAIAFAAQKTLEQLLGGIVIYLDRPFVVDDYIGLPDGTFGKVESIGLRSTRIRTSGKGTVIIAPNSSLTQVNIENYTRAKKVISLIYITFSQTIPESEQAFIRQIIFESTKDIFGIDLRNTEVKFINGKQNKPAKNTQVQISFFILGSGKLSMELRQQLLDIAKQNLSKELKKYGVAFELEQKTINVDSPITI